MPDETFQWVDVDGNVHDFEHASSRVLKGVLGRGLPPVEAVTYEVPLQPGERLRILKTKAREVSVPVAIISPDAATLRADLRTWARRIRADAGPGVLRVNTPAGDTRDLNCIYTGGFELAEDSSTAGETWQKALPVFRALDPYWYDSQDVSILFEFDGTAVSWFPIFPLSFTSAELFGSASVDNDGDVEAWPVWTVDGPGDLLVLTNATTGKTLSLDVSLTSSGQVVVDTRPGAKTVVDQDGASVFSGLSTDSALWPLAPGVNAVRIELENATSDSRVQLRYRRRYLTA